MTSLPTIRKRRKRWNLFFLALPLMLGLLKPRGATSRHSQARAGGMMPMRPRMP